MKKKSILYLFLFVVITVSCCSVKTVNKNQPDWKLYEQAIVNAMSPDSLKIYSHLIEVRNQNDQLTWKTINDEDYLLVVSWKQDISYYKPYLDSSFYDTGNYEIWVTTSPELLNRMNKEKYTDADTRLKQLLGLPPNSVYSYFVEFWVKPSDLFRPCPDKEIDDNSCSLCFPAEADSAHIAWIDGNRISRYYECDLYDKYPWTQLGYTYDWNIENHTHVGLSEFVIDENSNIVVNAIYTTTEYLNKGK